MTAISVERVNVGPRFVMVPVAGGPTMAAEGVEFRANCGCVAVVGLRVDNQDKTLGYKPCATHKPQAEQFLVRFTAPDAPAIDTTVWMAALLEELEP